MKPEQHEARHSQTDSTRAQILPLQRTDLEALCALEVSAYAFPWSSRSLLESLTQDPIRLGIWLDGRLIGYLFAQIVLDEIHLLNFTIHPSWQRQGWGRQLLGHLLDLARHHSCAHLYLEVRCSNAPAIRLYQQAGCRAVGLRPGYYPAVHGREDALVMVLAL